MIRGSLQTVSKSSDALCVELVTNMNSSVGTGNWTGYQGSKCSNPLISDLLSAISPVPALVYLLKDLL